MKKSCPNLFLLITLLASSSAIADGFTPTIDGMKSYFVAASNQAEPRSDGLYLCKSIATLYIASGLVDEFRIELKNVGDAIDLTLLSDPKDLETYRLRQAKLGLEGHKDSLTVVFRTAGVDELIAEQSHGLQDEANSNVRTGPVSAIFPDAIADGYIYCVKSK